MSRTSPDTPGWNVLSDDALLDLLRRAHTGEAPGLLMTEAYANADIESGKQE